MSDFFKKIISVPTNIRFIILSAVLFTGLVILTVAWNEPVNEANATDPGDDASKSNKTQAQIYVSPREKQRVDQPRGRSFAAGKDNSNPDTLSVSELEQKYKNLKVKDIMQLLSSDLPPLERNYLEHLLAESKDDQIDTMLDDMLEDGYLDLSTGGEEISEIEDSVFLTAATNRMNSAIRVTGLRGNKETVGNIIDIASHHNAKESTVRACYEAIGYLGTAQGKSYLLGEFYKQKNPFLKSEIILSLTTAGSSSNTDLYLSLLKSYDTDLRNSAIVALGEAKVEKAVNPFGKMFAKTAYSSQVLIIQALKKIDTVSAEELLEKLSDSHPDIVNGSSNSGEE